MPSTTPPVPTLSTSSPTHQIISTLDPAMVLRTATRGIGTDNYRAPEVNAMVEYDPSAADLWSIGMTLFFLVSVHMCVCVHAHVCMCLCACMYMCVHVFVHFCVCGHNRQDSRSNIDNFYNVHSLKKIKTNPPQPTFIIQLTSHWY